MPEPSGRQRRPRGPVAPHDVSVASADPGGVDRGDEVGEQPGDALGLVLVPPVRRVGRSLDAVRVRHVGAVRPGRFGTRRTVTLAADDQRGRRSVPRSRRRGSRGARDERPGRGQRPTQRTFAHVVVDPVVVRASVGGVGLAVVTDVWAPSGRARRCRCCTTTVTSAPSAAAIWTARLPMSPAAPLISTRRPARTPPTSRIARRAVSRHRDAGRLHDPGAVGPVIRSRRDAVQPPDAVPGVASACRSLLVHCIIAAPGPTYHDPAALRWSQAVPP